MQAQGCAGRRRLQLSSRRLGLASAFVLLSVWWRKPAHENSIAWLCGCTAACQSAGRAHEEPNLRGARQSSQRTRFALRAAAADQPPAEISPLQKWWNETVEFWVALEITGGTPLEEDEAPEAKALLSHLQLMNSTSRELADARRASKGSSRGALWEGRMGSMEDKLALLFQGLPGITWTYYRMRMERTFSRPAVKRGFGSSIIYVQIAVALVFLRVLAPRLLVAGSLDEFSEAATAIGIPDRATLQAGLQELQSRGTEMVAGLYLLAFVLEKLTMVSEFLPIQIGLKTIAPVIFGGLIPGALASATCETIAASCNFFIGKTFISKRIDDFTAFDMRLGDASWYGALKRRARDDGFQLTLLLRLAPVLPLPFDSYWYLLGALRVDPFQFFTAHWLGCLKTAFLDASFGVLLLSTIMTVDDAAVQSQAQEILLVETIGLAVVATLVGTVATRLINEMLGLEDETEDKDKSTALVADASDSGKADAVVAAKASPVGAATTRKAD